jgi:hypothetical protein
MELAIRAALSGLLIALAATIARKNPAAGALIMSLPLLSVLTVIWLWHDTGNATRIAIHMEATFWYVLPTLPMLLFIPWMLRHGVGFWIALIAGCVLTFLLYLATVPLAAHFGIKL